MKKVVLISNLRMLLIFLLLNSDNLNNTYFIFDINFTVNKRLKKILDTILNNLSPDVKDIIELKYMNKMSWDNIVDRVYCNKKTAMKYRDIAINSIAVGLFGSKIYREGNPTLFDLIEI